MAVDQSNEEGLEERVARLESFIAFTLLNTRDGDPKIRRLVLDWLTRLNRREEREALTEPRTFAVENGVDSNFDTRLMAVEFALGETSHLANNLALDLQNLHERVDSQLRKLLEKSRWLEHSFQTISHETHMWLTVFSLGLDPANVKLVRFFPVRLYVSENSFEAQIFLKDRLEALLDVAGIEITDDFPIIYASWFGRFLGRTKEACTSSAVTDRLEKVERALELQGLDKPQAEVDSQYINAAAAFIKAVEGSPNVAAQVGPLLIVKATLDDASQIQVKKLSIDQLLALEKNQSWLQSPTDVLMRLGICPPTKGDGFHGEPPASPSPSIAFKKSEPADEDESIGQSRKRPRLPPPN